MSEEPPEALILPDHYPITTEAHEGSGVAHRYKGVEASSTEGCGANQEDNPGALRGWGSQSCGSNRVFGNDSSRALARQLLTQLK